MSEMKKAYSEAKLKKHQKLIRNAIMRIDCKHVSAYALPSFYMMTLDDVYFTISDLKQKLGKLRKLHDLYTCSAQHCKNQDINHKCYSCSKSSTCACNTPCEWLQIIRKEIEMEMKDTETKIVAYMRKEFCDSSRVETNTDTDDEDENDNVYCYDSD